MERRSKKRPDTRRRTIEVFEPTKKQLADAMHGQRVARVLIGTHLFVGTSGDVSMALDSAAEALVSEAVLVARVAPLLGAAAHRKGLRAYCYSVVVVLENGTVIGSRLINDTSYTVDYLYVPSTRKSDLTFHEEHSLGTVEVG